MIEVQQLRKRYRGKLALKDISFDVPPGSVTAFLGPNGAGKSTTMRILMGLDHQTSGTATIHGVPYRELHCPLTAVGALLESPGGHPRRSVRSHLTALARGNGLARNRVEEALELVGLAAVGHQTAGRLSLGMSQRVGIAGALLGDPQAVILDEPMNGLDPAAIVWLRGLLRDLAAQGRAVLVSSHLMNEQSLLADRVVVIGRGEILAAGPVQELMSRYSSDRIRIRTASDHYPRLQQVLREAGGHLRSQQQNLLEVTGLSTETVGDLITRHAIPVYELTPQGVSLEEAFMRLTAQDNEFTAQEKTTTRGWPA
ncbi:ABC transporter ATP-binding protein [Streptomyces sioyaensis]|uniref:ABC transporter ATP-binding protein n=1 Tax=Streptomyces TaxID=1883 RepID=UPI001010BDD8|nr:ATP-binding cassette domain-containing protein [Streptomyces sp. TM32]RXS68761.1 ATP-binding cassette domain-containing protein [Streptomyces sp. TM32]